MARVHTKELLSELAMLGIKVCHNVKSAKIRIYSKQLYELFKQFGDRAINKYIPDNIFELSRESLMYLFKWLMWGDGHVKNAKPVSYTTISKQLADDMQRLCLHIGFAANINTKMIDSCIRTRAGVSYDYFRSCYDVRIITTKLEPEVNHAQVKKQKIQKEYFVERNDPVYCIEVPGHVIYVRRNGKACWCGNSNRFGAKGVIGEIVPDDQMPQTPDGPADVVYNSTGNLSRTNYSMVHEHVLGRIAKKLGRPIKIESFDPKNPDNAEYVMKLAKEHGINVRDPIIDPETGKPITGSDGKGLGWGYSYCQKLHHSAEDKVDERSFGSYTADEQPACLQAGSQVLTRDGLKPIEELVGQSVKVWTGFNWAPAVGLNMGVHQLAEIELENGIIIRCDTKHKLKNEADEWVNFENLKIGQKVACNL